MATDTSRFAHLWQEREGTLLLVLESAQPCLRSSMTDVLTDFLDFSDVDELYDCYPIDSLMDWLASIKGAESLPKVALAEALPDGLVGEDLLVAEFWHDLISRMEKASEVQDALYRRNLDDGRILFHHLPRHFRKGSHVVVDGEWFRYGGKVARVDVVRTFRGKVAVFKVDVISLVEGAPAAAVANRQIEAFKDAVPLDSLRVRMIGNDAKDALVARNSGILALCVPGAYLRYSGNVSQDSYHGERIFRGEGRVVIDPAGMQRMSPDRWQQSMQGSGLEGVGRRERSTRAGSVEVPPGEAWRVWPAVYGFSMRAKQWGRLDGWLMDTMRWRDDAFDRVVMDERRKSIVRTLVEHNGGGFEDIVDSKGGGLIVLLEGPPGTGKTLLAETTAETLHRPLYSVNVGELGVDPGSLEESLRNILDVAMSWNAVILIDEADVFLAKRDTENVERNALVSVFLRLLEYHQGVLFLTTNRASDIDEAFASRISIRLRFKAADQAKQRLIWEGLLHASGNHAGILEGLELPGDLNGREIRNLIKQGQTLARAEGVPMSAGHLRTLIEFQADDEPA